MQEKTEENPSMEIAKVFKTERAERYRRAPPDVVVVVGEGEEEVKFDCHSDALKLGSEVLSANLSTAWKKKNSEGMMELKFPHIDPKTWHDFYCIMESCGFKDVTITKDNIFDLYPVFHQFGFLIHMNICDKMLASMVPAKATQIGKSTQDVLETIPFLRIALLYEPPQLCKKISFDKVFSISGREEILLHKDIVKELIYMSGYSDNAWDFVKGFLNCDDVKDSDKTSPLLPKMLFQALQIKIAQQHTKGLRGQVFHGAEWIHEALVHNLHA